MSLHNKTFNKNYHICFILNVHPNAFECVPVQVPIFIAFECNTFASEFIQKNNPKFNKFKNTKNNYNKQKLISQQSFRMTIYNSLCCTCLQPFQLIKNQLFLSLNSLQASVILITSTPSITKTFPHVCYHLLK